MAEFKVTREMVQEAAEIGISQLTGFHAPKRFEEWEDEPSGSGCELKFNGYDLEDLTADPNYVEFAKVAQSILTITRESTNPKVRVTLKPSSPIIEAPGKQFLLQHHVDGVISDGFSILCAIKPMADEHLSTLGRKEGERDGKSLRQARYYAKGAILMAQRDFGLTLAKASNPSGRTIHAGFRKEAGKLIILDFSYGDWPI